MTDDIQAFRERLQKQHEDESLLKMFLLMTPEERQIYFTPQGLQLIDSLLKENNQ